MQCASGRWLVAGLWPLHPQNRQRPSFSFPTLLFFPGLCCFKTCEANRDKGYRVSFFFEGMLIRFFLPGISASSRMIKRMGIPSLGKTKVFTSPFSGGCTDPRPSSTPHLPGLRFLHPCKPDIRGVFSRMFGLSGPFRPPPTPSV